MSAVMRLTVLAMALIATLPLHADERPIESRVAPTYPELAKRMRITGTVKISATVAADGKVSASKTISGNHMLAGAAEDAVLKWKFAPASDESVVEVDVNFALAQ